jgi:hypothetical protein
MDGEEKRVGSAIGPWDMDGWSSVPCFLALLLLDEHDFASKSMMSGNLILASVEDWRTICNSKENQKNPRTHHQINMIEFRIWSSEVIFRSFTAEFGGQFQFGGRICAKDNKKMGIHSPWPSWPRGDWLEFWNDYQPSDLQFVLYALLDSILSVQIWKNWGSLRCVLFRISWN